MKFVETYNYNGCEFRIYEDKYQYYAKCEEMNTHGDSIQSLKNTDIPNCYRTHRIFKLGGDEKNGKEY